MRKACKRALTKQRRTRARMTHHPPALASALATMCHMNHRLLLMKQGRLRARMMHHVPTLASARATMCRVNRHLPSMMHGSRMKPKTRTLRRLATAVPPHYSEDKVLATAFGQIKLGKAP
ncbi:hypothetical protein MTO96_021866 [Rhipicephalus appendiculatus]